MSDNVLPRRMTPAQKDAWERGWARRVANQPCGGLSGWALLGWQDCNDFYEPLRNEAILTFDQQMREQGKEYAGKEEFELLGY